MNKIKTLYYQIEKILSGVKFAVVIISLFALSLTVGTFVESYHGTDYANRLVYKSWWFITIEVLMFLSIFMATVVRLPPKRRLYGFYTVHAGLMILFIGSFFTYINGVDGSLQLLPNTPARSLYVEEDILKISYPKENRVIKFSLPYSSGPTKIEQGFKEINVVEFLPFAETNIEWLPKKSPANGEHSTHYLLFNPNFSQEVTLSLSPESDFQSSTKMGLLSLHYMPSHLADCFAKNSPSGFIVWNVANGKCYTPEEKKYEMGETQKKTKFVLIPFEDRILKFFPDFSPVAIKDDLTKDTSTPFRILSKNVFQDKPNLFLFGPKVSFYSKFKKKWLVKDLKESIVSLPWMNFKLKLKRHEEDLVAAMIPSFTKPVQDNGKMIKGEMKAVKIQIYGQDYWVRSDAPLQLTNGKAQMQIELTQKEMKLPYQITLERFKMNTNPGTNDPASYESFVQLLDGRTTQGVMNHHVFMNNPLKYDDFTFYQSSYFPIGENQFGSVFSVNYDPGRFFKYLGSLFIVLGSIWHYLLNRRKKAIL